MSEDRERVVNALRQGALHSKAEYVTVRREDLLLALGVDDTANLERTSTTDYGQRTRDKQR